MQSILSQLSGYLYHIVQKSYSLSFKKQGFKGNATCLYHWLCLFNAHLPLGFALIFLSPRCFKFSHSGSFRKWNSKPDLRSSVLQASWLSTRHHSLWHAMLLKLMDQYWLSINVKGYSLLFFLGLAGIVYSQEKIKLRYLPSFVLWF